jgi:hypothetical protein
MNDIRNSRDNGFDKDLEVQSVHSSSIDIEEDEGRREDKGGVLTEKDDIEAYPVVDETQDEEKRQKDAAVTRTSTKGSWRDPGPPPDGGREAWIQSLSHSSCSHLSILQSLCHPQNI